MSEKQRPAFGNRIGGRAIVPKPKQMGATIRRLAGYLKNSVWLLLLTLIAAIAGTVMQVFSPKILGKATTTIFEGLSGSAGIDFTRLTHILLIVGALYLGVFFTTFIQQRLMVVVSQKMTRDLRGALKAKMNRVPVSYFDKNSTGNLMSVASNDTDNIVTNLQQSLTALISNIILVVGILWIMFSISVPITLLACLMVPGSIIIMKFYTPRTKKYAGAYYKELGVLNGQIEETFQGIDIVKSFNNETASIHAFEKTNDEMIKAGWKMKFFGGTMMPCMLFFQNVVYVLVAVAAAASVVTGKIIIGDMQAFLQYAMQFSNPISTFSQVWNNLISIIVSAERVFEILDAEEVDRNKLSFPDSNGEPCKVKFQHLTFSYDDAPFMQDFNMSVQEGQMIAIVGHTGAGKTTLINLLERFYDVQGGGIYLDGADIRNFSHSELRSRLGMVLQDTWLFSGTIYDNIQYGNEKATEEQIFAVAKAAYADEFIQKLANGYDTVLGEDADNISQGQKQLITIARAFVSNPEILILDEATSNVDSRTELIIQRAMKRLLKGRTSFVVAHRLSTIYDADTILVMDRGDIAE
ncbi:MAG: ABC transporter ATP-binding protein/permease, partial [Peptococcaceae bacterium]|nr:ABC transporter ATP-binding protein/permease [Peptococcaceae bacterium]